MRLVFDIETNAIDFSLGTHVEQATDVWCIVAYDIDHEHFFYARPDHIVGTPTIEIMIEGYPWVNRDMSIAEMVKLLEEADELIGHNIIQFDIPALKKLFSFKPSGTITDTLVISRTLYPDRPGGHGLNAWGERLGSSKGDFKDFSQYSEEMLRYCKQDVLVNSKVHQYLLREFGNKKWDRPLELEHRIAEIIAEQEQRGCYFFKSDAEKLVEQWNSTIASIDESVLATCGRSIEHYKSVARPYKINGEPTKQSQGVAEDILLDHDLIGGPYCAIRYVLPDLNSKQDQKKLLLEKGWVPSDTTPTGQPKLNESILSVEPIGSQLHNRNQISHRLNQVRGLINVTDEQSRIHGGANPCGTNTGRMRHSRIANIPRPTSYLGEEVRSLFGVPSGRLLLGYDASSLELRMLAHYLGSPEYNDKVTSTDKENDAHTLAAKAAGLDDRDTGKTINYALIYGAGDRKLGSIIGGTTNDGRVLRQRLYTEIPGLGDLVNRVQRAAKKGHLIGLDGRKIWIRAMNSALNALLQSAGAIFMKTSTRILDERVRQYNLDSFKVIDMHDEAQWDCNPDDIEVLKGLVPLSFELATEQLELTCPQEAEVKVGTTWTQTH